MMRILFTGRGYPSKNQPGNGGFEATQAHAIKKLGHEVIYVVIKFTTLRKPFKAGLSFHEENGIPVYELCSIVPYGRLPRWMFYYFRKRQIQKLYKIVEKNHGKPDLLHGHYLRPSALMAVLKKKHDIPLVISEHWSALNNDKLSFEVKFLGKRTYRYADLVIAVSEVLSKRIKQHFGISSKVIHNMVDSVFFEEQDVQTSESGFSFISVARLVQGKGYDVLLKAFQLAFGKEHDVSLKIVGDGAAKKDLDKISNSLGLSRQVIFTGQKTSQEIRELLAASDAFALASRAETFGVVFIEAMAQGLPVIGTRCGGPEEFVDESNGIVVDLDDVEALSKAMRYVYENRDSYDSEKIARQCEERFSEEKIAEKLVREYEQIVLKD